MTFCTLKENVLITAHIMSSTYLGPGVDSAPSENEYQEHFLEVKVAGA